MKILFCRVRKFSFILIICLLGLTFFILQNIILNKTQKLELEPFEPTLTKLTLHEQDHFLANLPQNYFKSKSEPIHHFSNRIHNVQQRRFDFVQVSISKSGITSITTEAFLQNSCELVRRRIESPHVGGDRCRRIKQLVAQGLLEYVLREADEELCALVRPLFTNRKLVIWTSDHHSAPVLDLRSMLEPLGVEFIDHTLFPSCRFYCLCDGKRNLKVLTEENVLEMGPELMERFHKAYPVNNSDFARVDAFAMFHCSSQYEMFRIYNKSIISIATLRYETCRKPRRWTELNETLSKLYGRPEHVIGTSGKYDKEYIRYFTGLKVDLVPNFCAYTGGWYNPITNNGSYLLYPQRDGFAGQFAKFWNSEFTNHYKMQNATFKLVSKQTKYTKDWVRVTTHETWDLGSYLGIVNVPYQTSTMSISEHYRMGIPLFFAAHDTFVKWNIKYRLVYDRTSAMREGFSYKSEIPPHESQRGIPDPNDERDPVSQNHWFHFADYYTLPHITYFKSIEHLVNILQNTSSDRLLAISAKMRAFNREQLKQLLHYWRTRLIDISASSSNKPY